MKWRTQKKAGAVILAFGVAPLLTVICVGLSYNVTPLDTPILLKPGEFRSPEFKTEPERQYFLSLVGDAVIEPASRPFAGPDLKKLWCMMGVTADPRPLNCDGVEQSIDFDWQVVSRQGQVLVSGSYKPIGFGNLDVQFGEVQTRGNARQRVILTIRRDGRELNDHHLRLKVEAVHESDLPLALPYWLLMSEIWAGIVGATGILAILVPWPRRKIRSDSGRG